MDSNPVRLVRLTDAQRTRFDDFVAAWPNGDVLQTWAWGDLKAKSGWRPYRFAIQRGDEWIGTVLILGRRISRLPVQLLYAPRGPVMDYSDPELVAQVTRLLKDWGKKNGGFMLKIDPPEELPLAHQNLISAGFIKVQGSGFGGTQPKCVMQLDLGPTEQQLMANFHQKWRYNIRLAEKKGVQVNIEAGREDLKTFYELLMETCKRDGFLVRSQAYFESMWDLLEPLGQIKLAITTYEGEPVSGALCYILGDRAWYTYGSSSNRHRNVMPNHLMQWRLIQWAKAAGCRWYDFRGVSPKTGAGDSHLDGLNRFKEGFSPRFVEYIGDYDLILNPAFYWLWEKARPKVERALRRKSAIKAAPGEA
jgi:lipid II:glycine glycyltransferase (peptidoglycan interpeptide bridge formation enzyme)